MNILDLPLEIFRQILDDFVGYHSHGTLWVDPNVECVAHAHITFEREILEILKQRNFLLTPKCKPHWSWEWDDRANDLLFKYVASRPYSRETGTNIHFPALVNTIVELFVQPELGRVGAEQQRKEYLKELCRRANKDKGLFVESLLPNSVHAFVGAIYLGRQNSVDGFLKHSSWVAYCNSEYWGSPLLAAIRVENLKLVQRLLTFETCFEKRNAEEWRACFRAAVLSEAAETIIFILLTGPWTISYYEQVSADAICLALEVNKANAANTLLEHYKTLVEQYKTPAEYRGRIWPNYGRLRIESCRRVTDRLRNRLCDMNSHQYERNLWHGGFYRVVFEACATGYEDVSEDVVQIGAKTGGEIYEHPLLKALARGGHVGLIRIMLDAGETLNSVQALKILRETAPRPYSADAVWLLLQRGIINIDRLDKGFLATDTYLPHLITSAVQYGNTEFVEALVRYGVPVDDEAFYAERDCPLPIVTAIAFQHKSMISKLRGLGARDADPMQSVIAWGFESGRFPCDPPPPMEIDVAGWTRG